LQPVLGQYLVLSFIFGPIGSILAVKAGLEMGMENVEVAIAVVKKGRKILICKRKVGGSLGGFWEFPGGKREPGESLEACLSRELMEEVGMTARVVERLTPIRHDYGQTRVTLNPFLCEHTSGEPTPIACERVEWVEVMEFGDYTFPPANEPLLMEIEGKIGREY
jgi:mutator protein MutT